MIPNIYTATGLVATGGAEEGFAIPVADNRRGTLTRCYVVQTGGALEGYTYALYCDAAACPPGADPTANATVPAGLYNVVPLQTVATGKADPQGTWPADGVNHLWQPYSASVDGRGASLFGGQQQLYIKIAPGGSAAKTFAVSLTILPPVFT